MLRKRLLPVALVLASVVLPTAPVTGFAQTCLGRATFATGQVQLGATTVVATGVGSTGLALAAGTRTIFGGLAVAVDYFTGPFPYAEGYALEGSARLGYQVQAGSRFSVCPIVSYRGQYGPRDLAASVTTVRNRYSAGVGAGRLLPLGRLVALVPTVTLSVAHDADRLEQFGSTQPVDLTFVSAETGVGFVLGRRWTIRPIVAFPLTSRDRRLTSWGASVSVNL
jgi:hypothetical protein